MNFPLSTESDDTVRTLVAAWLNCETPFDAVFYARHGGYVRNASDRVAAFAAVRDRYFAKRGAR